MHPIQLSHILELLEQGDGMGGSHVCVHSVANSIFLLPALNCLQIKGMQEELASVKEMREELKALKNEMKALKSELAYRKTQA